MPTGSGKTVVASHLVDECLKKGKNAVFVVDRVTLVDQTSRTFDEYGIDHGVVQADHWRKRAWKNVQVASADTVARRSWPLADLIVVDECHTVKRVVKDRIELRNCVTIGLSATPFTKGLGKLYDSVVTVRTTNQLIADGFLSKYRVFAASEPDMTGAKVVAGEWTDDVAAERSMPIVGDCVAEYLKHGDGKKFIAFGVNVAHCEEMQKQFMSAGVQCELYTYHTGDDERRMMVEEFRKPDSYIRGLISVSALSKGFDVADVEVVILARPLRNGFAEHIQMLGRGLRPHPDKPVCTILDHAGNTLRFWDRMQEFFENGANELDDGRRKDKKTKPKKEREPVKCSKCFAVHKPSPMCPACGYAYPRRVSEISHIAGDLMELTGAVKAGDERQALYSQLLWIARDKSYKSGWASHKFKERTGVWPNGLNSEEAAPTPALLRWVKSQMIRWAKSA
jgi:superfamily II DNA or RNA helicase